MSQPTARLRCLYFPWAWPSSYFKNTRNTHLLDGPNNLPISFVLNIRQLNEILTKNEAVLPRQKISRSQITWLFVCFRKPRRKRGIRGNQSIATAPYSNDLPINLQFRSNIWRERLCVCRLDNKSADWLITLPYSLHRTLIWPSNVAYFSGTGEFSELRRPPAEISGLSFLRRACENRLLSRGTHDLLFCCTFLHQSIMESRRIYSGHYSHTG